jgi:alkyldihydroxyacetonephosphate synthase
MLAALRQERPGLRVSQDPMDLLACARDASTEGYLERRHGLLPPGPAAVVWPADEEDVRAVVRAAGRARVPLSPLGAASGVVHGTSPGPSWVVLDLKLLDQVALDPARGWVTAGAGVVGERLERALNAQGFSVGHFPSSIYCSTVGGWVAARGAGQLSSRYGKIEDLCVSLRFVDGKGRFLVLNENEQPGLMQSIIGSEGSLGVITAATLRVHPLPSHRALAGFAAPDVATGLSFMRQVMQAGLRPAVFRMYDPTDTLLAGGIPRPSAPPQVQEGCLGRAGLEDDHAAEASVRNASVDLSVGQGWESRLRQAALRVDVQPHLQEWAGWLLARGPWLRRVACSVPSRCLVVLGLEGTRDDVGESLASSLELARNTGAVLLGRGPGERWLTRRYAVTWKMPPLIRAGGWADTLEASAAWSDLPALYADARAATLRHALTLAHFSHAYPEGASIYFTLAGGGGSLEESRRVHRAAVDAALGVFLRHGAALSHHHGVGRMKAGHLSASLGAGAAGALRGLKSALDPHGILNPGVLGLGGGAS